MIVSDSEYPKYWYSYASEYLWRQSAPNSRSLEVCGTGGWRIWNDTAEGLVRDAAWRRPISPELAAQIIQRKRAHASH